jgi:hypothetical protein
MLNDAWYSRDGIQWNEATPSAEFAPRAGQASPVYDNRVWVIGGIARDHILNDVWYSLDGIQWTEATSSAEFPGRFDFPALVLNDRIWVIGGAASNNSTVGSDAWYTSMTSSPAPSTAFASSMPPAGAGQVPWLWILAAIVVIAVVYTVFTVTRRPAAGTCGKKDSKKNRKKKR